MEGTVLIDTKGKLLSLTLDHYAKGQRDSNWTFPNLKVSFISRKAFINMRKRHYS